MTLFFVIKKELHGTGLLFCHFVGDLAEQDNRIFRMVERFVDELWDFARFNSSLLVVCLSIFFFVNSS